MMRLKRANLYLGGAVAALVLAISACESGTLRSPGSAPGNSSPAQQAAPSAPEQHPQQTAVKDPSHLLIALKYVSYIDENGKPVISETEAKTVVDEINKLYASCNVEFRTEEYLSVAPKDRQLPLNPSSPADLEPIRKEFDVPSEMVVINTGKWDHSGGLGADGANAWTAMPGQTPMGAVIEAPVATNGPLVAHELGHYLSLDHDGDSSDLMSPVVYPTSTTLRADQCQSVREAAQGADSHMLR
jgi:hypothetical protein